MEAMELFPTALRELPDSPSINFVGANILGKLNRYEEAERYFKKAIYLFGERVQPVHYANLGKHILHSRYNSYLSCENGDAMRRLFFFTLSQVATVNAADNGS